MRLHVQTYREHLVRGCGNGCHDLETRHHLTLDALLPEVAGAHQVHTSWLSVAGAGKSPREAGDDSCSQEPTG